MAIHIRPASPENQQTIVSFIRQAKINPRNLHWEHFHVAEENGQIVGIRQERENPNYSNEKGVTNDNSRAFA